jgi:hypothetical protein
MNNIEKTSAYIKALERNSQTIRVSSALIIKMKKLIDDAYWALETQEHVLHEAERPLINNPEQAQESIGELAILIDEEFEDLGLDKLDEQISELKSVVEDFDEKVRNLAITGTFSSK